MTKQDYIIVAAAIAHAHRQMPADADQAAECARAQAAREIAETLAFAASRDNPRFDRGRFMAACGWQQHSEG